MLLAVINMLTSFLTAESTENDAVRINLVGSLRMQSYRIAEALLIQNNEELNPKGGNMVADRIAEFEERFNRPVLIEHIAHSGNTELIQSIETVDAQWQQLKSRLSTRGEPNPELLNAIDNFVLTVDGLVKKLELQTESKFKILRILQGISLLVTVIIVVIGYVDISSNVVGPLKRLLKMAGNIQAGDFSQRLESKGEDELSVLTETFNDMSRSLELMYRDLEKKVQEKTHYLEQARDELGMLYEISKILSSDKSIVDRIEASLINIKNYIPDSNVSLNLQTGDSNALPLPITGFNSEDHKAAESQEPLAPSHQYKFKVSTANNEHGDLEVLSHVVLSTEQLSLLQVIADNIASALHGEWRLDQQHRLVLMEEIVDRIEASLINIKNYIPDSNVSLNLQTGDSNALPSLITGFNSEGHKAAESQAPLAPSHQYKFKVSTANNEHGDLEVLSHVMLSTEQLSLLQVIADNIASALHGEWRLDQQHRLVLMEERTVIARELHDSLAQSLSYLKIQISRLQMLKKKDDKPEELDNTITHIKTGIDAAYRQLRELLATFRLQLSNKGLKVSLEKTVEEFSDRDDLTIGLEYQINNLSLSPNEEIHILQIVRESLSNVIRHSNAGLAEVKVTADKQGVVSVTIDDNGCGFKPAQAGNNHYGKIIMQERAKTLGGQVLFLDNQWQGASVQLNFEAISSSGLTAAEDILH